MWVIIKVAIKLNLMASAEYSQCCTYAVSTFGSYPVIIAAQCGVVRAWNCCIVTVLSVPLKQLSEMQCRALSKTKALKQAFVYRWTVAFFSLMPSHEGANCHGNAKNRSIMETVCASALCRAHFIAIAFMWTLKAHSPHCCCAVMVWRHMHSSHVRRSAEVAMHFAAKMMKSYEVYWHTKHPSALL